MGVAHKVWRHLWDTPGARVGLFSKTIKSAKQGGVWEDLLNVVGPHWIESEMIGDTGLPIAYTTKDGNGNPGQKTDAQSRTAFFRIRNRFGGESELILFSLDDDNEVEAKVKGTRFSMIWFSELSNFKSRKVFEISLLQLRMPHLRFEDHQWIADTNPAEEGIDSWIYKLWFEERVRDNHKDPEFQKGIKLIDFCLDDNPWLDPRERRELESLYDNDPGEYDRNVLGKWTKGHGSKGRVFADILIPNLHFIEGCIDIPPETDLLYGGWDIGNINCAFHALEKRMVKRMIDGQQREIKVWLVLDEVVTLDERISTGDFTELVMEKMIALEQWYQRGFKWVHWSDSTALTTFRPGIDGFDATEVSKASKGQIELQAADKPNLSVHTAIKILRRAIREKRFYCGTNCPKTIEMLENLEYGTRKSSAGTVRAVDDSDLKHPFDSLRYPIYMEERDDLISDTVQSSGRGSKIISV